MAEKYVPDYNEDLYGKSESKRPSQPAARSDYGEDIYGKKPLPSILRGGQPFGEIRARDPQSWTQSLKEALQGGLEYLGAEPYRARHVGGGTVGAASVVSPLGSILSTADLTHHLGTGQYGEAAWDAIGAIPFLSGINKYVRGRPQVSQIRVAESPPPWVRHGEVWNQNSALAPVVPGAGWSVPSVMELIGRGPGGGARATPITGTAVKAYRAVENAPLAFNADMGPLLGASILSRIESPAGGAFNRSSAKGVYRTINDNLKAWEAHGGPITGSDIETLRQQLRGLPATASAPRQGVAGMRASDEIDRFLNSAPSSSLAIGTPADLATLRTNLATARGDYRGGETSRKIEAAIDRAGTRTAVTYSGGNLENKTRQNMEALGREPLPHEADRLFGATPKERQAVLAASQPSWMEDQNRMIYKVLGGGGGLGRTAATSAAAAAGAGFGHAIGLDPALAFTLGAAVAPIPYIAGTTMRNVGASRAVKAAEEAAALPRINTPEGRLRAASPEFEQVTDPRGMMRDAISYALMPQAGNVPVDILNTGNPMTGREWWNEKFVPYENRDEGPLRITVRPQNRGE